MAENYLSNFVIAATMILGITMLIFFLIGQEGVKDFVMKSGEKMDSFFIRMKKFYINFSVALTPKSESEIGEKYRKFLMYSKYDTKEFFLLKNSMFLIVLVFFIAVTVTDSNLGVKEIYTKFEYVTNPLFNAAAYDEKEQKVLINQKNKIFDYLKDDVGIDVILSLDPDTALSIIEANVEILNETKIDNTTIAEEMYQKVKDYRNFKRPNFYNCFTKALIIYFLPEAFIFLINFFNKSSERAEKRFMKRLIIMNGSIKPTDFMMVLSELIDKSKYYKKILKEIEDSNKKNYEENTKIYQKYIQESKDLDTKLFFEKLDEANNYDFDQAIINIKNEFNLDKRMQTRKVKKTVENIHVWGLVGFMMLIVFIIMYLLMPWMTAYDMNSLM